MDFDKRIFEADEATLARLVNETIVEPSVMLVDDNKDLVNIDRIAFDDTRYQFYTAGDYESLVRFLDNCLRTDLYILDADFPRNEKGKPELMFPEAVNSIRRYHKIDQTEDPVIVIRSGQDYRKIADELGVPFVGKGDKSLGNDLAIAEHYLAEFNRQIDHARDFVKRLS